jgi:hypothetical protein
MNGASISADVGPVKVYVKGMKAAYNQDRKVITIPKGTAAHACGYRFTSCLVGEDLDYALANGATLAEGE